MQEYSSKAMWKSSRVEDLFGEVEDCQYRAGSLFTEADVDVIYISLRQELRIQSRLLLHLLFLLIGIAKCSHLILSLIGHGRDGGGCRKEQNGSM